MSHAVATGFRMPCAPHAQAPAGRALAWLAVAGVHAGLFLWVLQQPEAVLAPRLSQTLSVSFVAEQPSAPQAVPPPPQSVAPPTPAPKLVATPSPASASAITVPPEEPEAVVAAEAAPAPAMPAAVATQVTSSEPAVVPPDYRAAYLNNPGPRYPVASRRRREQGLVMLKVRVSAEGAPEQVIVERSSGFEELDRAAASVVKDRWKFVPARQGNQAVAAWVAVPMEFALKER